MKSLAKIVALLAALLLVGCVTKDFKVVDALHAGMAPEEARAAIQAYGFALGGAIDRATSGWPKEREKAFADTGWRAGREEERTGKRIVRAEYYPVGHGFLGAGELYLFYGEDERLISFYRYQIN